MGAQNMRSISCASQGHPGKGVPPLREGKGRLESIIKSKGTPWEGTEEETKRERYREFK